MITRYQLLGKFFGFPQCCIDEFENNEVPYWERPEVVQAVCDGGFIPCPSCASKIILGQATLESLIQNRMCSIPFKIEHSKEEDFLLHQEVRKHLDEHLQIKSFKR